jgi:uncharacterized protein YbjT (DUF2867 family)
MYVITGATGNIGKVIAAELLEQGKKVRVVGRNADKLKELTENGAEPFVGDLNDAEFVKKAFSGATAAFCMIPPNLLSNDFRKDQQKVAHNYADAVKENGVKHVLLLSSIGAHLRNGAGIVDGLGDLEEYFLQLKEVNVLNLRPSYFMENLYGQIGMIKDSGIMGSAIKGDIPLPLVATIDIADMATKRLLNLNFSGNTIEYVLGPRDLSYYEVAKIVGKAIGKPELKYVQFSYKDAKKGAMETGFISENIADLFNGLSEAMNNGKALNGHKRTWESTTPTSLEEFAKIFAKSLQTVTA